MFSFIAPICIEGPNLETEYIRPFIRTCIRRITGHRDSLSEFGDKKRFRCLLQYSDGCFSILLVRKGVRHTDRIVRQVKPPGPRSCPSVVDVYSPTVYFPMWLRRCLIKTDAADLHTTKSCIASTFAATSCAWRSSTRGRNSPRSSLKSDHL